MRYRFLYISGSAVSACTRAALMALLLGILAAPQAHAFQTEAQKELLRTQAVIRGLTFMRTGFPDKAAAVYAEALRVSPDEPTLLSSMADAQLAMGEIGLASFYILGALEKAPDNIDLNRQALSIALESGNASEAIARSKRLVELQAGDESARMGHIELLERLQQWSAAEEEALSAVQRFPKSEALLRSALRVFLESGSLAPARLAAEKIVDITADPDDRYQLAAVLIRMDENEDAIRILNEILLEDPLHPDAMASLGALGALGEPRDAESQFFGTVTPESPSVGTPVADTLGDRLERALDRPEDAELASRTAEELQESGRLSDLLELATGQIDEDPRRLSMWIYAMEAHIGVNDYAAAIRLAEDGILLFPGYPPLLYQYARALSLSNRNADALQAAQKALLASGGDPELTSDIELLIKELQKLP
jgi:tetratricopeptide (TPR) repeat protein